MPNQRTVYGGATLVEGIFLGHDDPGAFAHISQTAHAGVHAQDDEDHVDIHALGGALDQGLIDGSLVIRFDSGVEDILYAVDKASGSGKFQIDKNAGVHARNVFVDHSLIAGGPCTFADETIFEKHVQITDILDVTQDANVGGSFKCASLEVTDGPTLIEGDFTTTGEVECHSLKAETVTGDAFSHLDDQGVLALDNVVARDPASGAVQIANLRCTARKVILDENGLAPDGLRPGLFMTEATCSEELRLIEDGRVLFHPEENTTYRFGSTSGGPP